jgi:Fe-S-cluster containining protein
MAEPTSPFFTFHDRSLRYDCAACGSACCKGVGLALVPEVELLSFARLEPRLATHLKFTSRLAEPLDCSTGCWMLREDGRCAIEETVGYAQKPAICRLFPYTRILRAGGVQILDVNSKICPLQDATAERNGQSWEALIEQLAGCPPELQRGTEVKLPKGATELGWTDFEGRLRDAGPAFFDEPDFAAYAAFQEEAVYALSANRPLPEPNAPAVLARAEKLRALVQRWRALFGVQGEPGLAEAARKAAKQVSLLSTSWRVNAVLMPKGEPYPAQIQRLPRQMLAASQLIELGHLGRRRQHGLRTATEVFQGLPEVATLLAMFPRSAQLHGKPQLQRMPPELQPVLLDLHKALAKKRPLGEAVEAALGAVEPALRGLALSALATSDARLEIW